MSWNHTSSFSRRQPPETLSLPPGFTPICELLEERVKSGTSVSIVGVVNDCMLPIPTKGPDHKCTLRLFDKSTHDSGGSITLNVFRDINQMPKVEVGDILIVYTVKYQIWNSTPSLLSSNYTDIHVYESRRLPTCRTSRSALHALKEPSRPVTRKLDSKVHEYVMRLYNTIDKSILPDPEEFAARAQQSLNAANAKDKFSLLEHIKDGQFADLVVQITRDPYNEGDKVSLWASDYTENDSFFNRTRDGADYTDGDPYGYMNKFSKQPTIFVNEANNRWTGPLGKKAIQITCWEPHANFVRQHVQEGDWVRLRNVHIRFGHNSVNLEGNLHQDRMFPGKVCVDVLDPTADRDTLDPHLIQALRRKRVHERTEKHSGKTGAAEKRKAEGGSKKDNAKSKRQRKRENQRKAEEEQKAREEAAINLNELIKCEHHDKAIVSLSVIIRSVNYPMTINNTPIVLELPFTCANYRTQARIVDFHPPSLKDFAVRRIISEYEAVLSDNEGSDSDSEDSNSSQHDGPHGKAVWEWRFALKLEEVSAPLPKTKSPVTAWVLVNNSDAELLTDLDAADLRANAERLTVLRERMFVLWGNLEERKSRFETKKRKHFRDPINAPPADSSDVEDRGREEGATEQREYHAPASSQLSNKPFTCCIRQYGIKVKAEESEEANAGASKRWERMLGLFGTKIVSD